MRKVTSRQLAQPEFRLALMLNEAIKIALRPMRHPSEASEDVLDVQKLTHMIREVNRNFSPRIHLVPTHILNPEEITDRISFRDVRNKSVSIPLHPLMLYDATHGRDPESIAYELAMNAYQYLSQVDGYSARKLDLTVEL